MMETKKAYDVLIDEAMELLNNDDDLLIDVVNDLDSWNGYADGFRGYAMSDLNELFYGVLLTDFLDKLGRDFNHNDNYFIDTIYGIESTDDLAGHYRDNVDIGCLLDDFIEEYEANHVEVWGHDDFEEVIEAIIEARQEASNEE